MTQKRVATFVQRLSELVRSTGMTDAQFGITLGVSKQTISAWLSETRSPKAPMVEFIAYKFNVSIPWLMGYDVPRTDASASDITLDETETKLIEAFRLAEDSAREYALDMLLSHPKEYASIHAAIKEAEATQPDNQRRAR